MANPTPYAISLIKNYINNNISGGFSNSNVYLTDRLNDNYYTANPTPPSYIYTSFQAPEILSLLSPSSIKNVLASPGSAVALLPLLNTLPHQETDINFIMTWAQAYYVSSIITGAEYVSITGTVLSQTPDPTWNSGVSWSMFNLNRYVDLDDIQSSR